MAKNPGAEFLGEVHPVGAQNKTLISDAVMLYNCLTLIATIFPNLSPKVTIVCGGKSATEPKRLSGDYGNMTSK